MEKIKIESLRFEGITFNFEGHDPILKAADFDFPMNDIVWMKSSEGAGKSTVLQILAGLETAQMGTYWINQKNVTEMSFEEFLPYRLSIGYSFDYGGLINNRTLLDNLMLPLVYHKILDYPSAKRKVIECLTHFGLAGMMNERPAHVPGRVRKLGCLLRALITEPDLLLLDDPSVGLGQETAIQFVEYIEGLREKGFCRHVFVSSYDDKFMNLMKYQLVHLDEGVLHFEPVDPQRRVVHL